MEELNKCLITDLPIKEYKKIDASNPFIQYKVDINSKEYLFRFCIKNDCIGETKKFIALHKDLLFTLLLNGKNIPVEKDMRFPNYEDGHLIHKFQLEKFIKDNPVLTSPNDKLNNLFISLSAMPTYEGEKLNISNQIQSREFQLKYYFKNKFEFSFYLNTLHSSGLIVYESGTFRLTYEGLLHSIKLQEEGINSNRCFVAMSFNKEEDYIFEDIIKPVCEEYNFLAIRVDRLHPGEGETINDLIIAEIKKSKFIISDFTKNKNGVYFEAGYGLGRGKKVIYTCSKNHFDNLHFDVNHFPVLIYESNDEFKKMLRNKIEAYILE